MVVYVVIGDMAKMSWTFDTKNHRLKQIVR